MVEAVAGGIVVVGRTMGRIVVGVADGFREEMSGAVEAEDEIGMMPDIDGLDGEELEEDAAVEMVGAVAYPVDPDVGDMYVSDPTTDVGVGAAADAEL